MCGVLNFILIYLTFKYFLLMCLKRNGALFSLGRNLFPDAVGLGLFVFLSLEVRMLSMLLGQDCLMNKHFCRDLLPPPYVSELNFPLHKHPPGAGSAPE